MKSSECELRTAFGTPEKFTKSAEEPLLLYQTQEDRYHSNVRGIVTLGSILVAEHEAALVANEVVIITAQNDPLGMDEFFYTKNAPSNVHYVWLNNIPGGHNGYGTYPGTMYAIKSYIPGMEHLESCSSNLPC